MQTSYTNTRNNEYKRWKNSRKDVARRSCQWTHEKPFCRKHFFRSEASRDSKGSLPCGSGTLQRKTIQNMWETLIIFNFATMDIISSKSTHGKHGMKLLKKYWELKIPSSEIGRVKKNLILPTNGFDLTNLRTKKTKSEALNSSWKLRCLRGEIMVQQFHLTLNLACLTVLE